jgi:hypothetical protein
LVRILPKKQSSSPEDFQSFFLRRGTFFPFSRASESPIAMACLRLVTFLPLRPLLSEPLFRFLIARSTSLEALREYLRAILAPPESDNHSGHYERYRPIASNRGAWNIVPVERRVRDKE